MRAVAPLRALLGAFALSACAAPAPTPAAAPAASTQFLPPPAPASASAVAALPVDLTTPDAPFRQHPPEPLPTAPFQAPAATRLKLRNGIDAYVVRMPSPFVSIRVLAAGGLADLEGAPPETVAVLLRAMALGVPRAQLEASGAPDPQLDWYRDGLVVSVSASDDRLPEALALAAEVALRPPLAPESVERAREQAANGFDSVRASDPLRVADLALRHVLYGSHVYARTVGSGARTRSIRVAEVAALHKRVFTAPRITLVLSGSVSPEEGQAALDAAFGSWPSSGSRAPQSRPVVPPSQGPRIAVVDAPGVEPAVAVGFVGPSEADPDRDAAFAATELLADSALGRLTTRLRDERHDVTGIGTTYNALRQAGFVELQMRTTSERVAPVLTEVHDVLQSFAAAPAPDDDVAAWRDRHRFSIASAFVTAAGTSRSYLMDLLSGATPGSSGHSAEVVTGVSSAQVQRAASRWLEPSHMRVVVVGDLASLRERLTALGWGPVEVRDADGELAKGAAYGAR